MWRGAHPKGHKSVEHILTCHRGSRDLRGWVVEHTGRRPWLSYQIILWSTAMSNSTPATGNLTPAAEDWPHSSPGADIRLGSLSLSVCLPPLLSGIDRKVLDSYSSLRNHRESSAKRGNQVKEDTIRSLPLLCSLPDGCFESPPFGAPLLVGNGNGGLLGLSSAFRRLQLQPS